MRLFLARQFHSKLGAAARTAARPYTTHSQLPSEHQMVYEMCRKFADEELAPRAAKWDKEHSFPKEAVDQLVCGMDVCSALGIWWGLIPVIPFVLVHLYCKTTSSRYTNE